MSAIPTQFHGIPADELHASCLALGLTMKAKASVVLALAEQQAQQAKEAAGNAENETKEEGEYPTPPPPPRPPAADDNFFVTMHPAITLRPITSCLASQFEDLQNKQPLWNILIDMLARHPTFLSEVLRDTAASDAAFTGRMLSMYEAIYLNKKAPIVYQPNMLGIFRNDYMEETVAAESVASFEHSSTWKQVEINTISVSFAGLAPKVGKFHQQVAHVAKNEVARRRPTALAPEERIHIGESDKVVPGALAAGAKQYLLWKQSAIGAAAAAAEYVPVVCFVIQENERNTTDQYMLSFEVENAHNFRCIRRTLRELKATMALIPQDAAASQSLPPLAIVDGVYEVAVFYFRSCYTPTDFPTEAQWDARRDIEMSAGIKCPSLPYYLCTFKKVQQIITGSRMRADGTPCPPPQTLSPASTPTGRGGAAKDFGGVGGIATPASEADHIQKLVAAIAADVKAKPIECPPSGRNRGALVKPFGVSAAAYCSNNAFASDDSVDIEAENKKNAFDLTYFTDGSCSSARLPTDWFTNWIRCNFVPIYSLNPKENPHAEEVIADAITNPRNYVLKPQLEGGGNLYSGDEMVTLLRIAKPEGDEATLSEPQREFLKTYWRVRNEYILMRRINVKKHSCDEVMSKGVGGNSITSSAAASPAAAAATDILSDDDASPLFRMGQIITKSQVRSACIGINNQPNDDLCSELGIYGVILSEGVAQTAPSSATSDYTNFSSVVSPTPVRILLNDSAGYVIRSKLASVDDGGVMAGAAFLDSIALRRSAASVSV